MINYYLPPAPPPALPLSPWPCPWPWSIDSVVGSGTNVPTFSMITLGIEYAFPSTVVVIVQVVVVEVALGDTVNMLNAGID